MRIIDLREVSLPISRYADASVPSGGLNTSMLALITDVIRDGKPVVGYGFASIGRFAQSGLNRERFAPRQLAGSEVDLTDEAGTNLDPFRAWRVMMTNEKPGGHGERCVAVGALDMALWDAAAKITRLPLYRLLMDRTGTPQRDGPRPVSVYAGGGYYYPSDDIARLSDEVRCFRDLGHRRAKIKIGSAPLAQDLKRIDAAARLLDSPGHVAVDAIYAYTAATSLEAAGSLAPLGLWWFEDICDPLDFETVAAVARRYAAPIATGEALFSAAEANLLDRHGGLRRDRDILVFDPVHCYGLPGYLQIIGLLEKRGWPHGAFWPHGGHLFCLHVVAALGLGGAEVNPLCFQPFGGYGDETNIANGAAIPPELPGIGFERKPALRNLRCVAYAKAHKHPELADRTIWQAFEAERPQLVQITGSFDGFHATQASVSKTCLVRFDNNKYSLASRAVGRPVEIQAYADRIVIRQEGTIVGEHHRRFGRGETIYDPWHYVPVLARKPGALRNGAPFKDWLLPASLERLRRKLQGSDDGDRQMVKVLAAVLTDGLAAVEAACAEALADGVHSADVVLNILSRRRDPGPAATILTPDALRLQHLPIADCARYDSLRRAC